jgi:hypothetical protein
MGSISRSENNGVAFDVALQDLIDWKEVGVPKENGTRVGEKKLFIFRKKKRQTYSNLLEALDNFKTENGEQEQQIAKWSKLLRQRLARIETEWERRKN